MGNIDRYDMFSSHSAILPCVIYWPRFLITTQIQVVSPQGLGLHQVAAADPGATQGVLDNFNHAGPELGSNWSSTGSAVVNNQLIGDADSQIFWQPSFGASQWASIKVVQLPRCNRLDLVLKARNNAQSNGLVDVVYSNCGSPNLLIYSYNPKYGHHSPFAGTTVMLGAGDIFSVSVYANHIVTVFINGTPVLTDVLATENAGFDVGRSGQIGLGTSSSAVVLDDFDGGNLSGPLPPTPAAVTPTPQSYDTALFMPLVLAPKTKRN